MTTPPVLNMRPDPPDLRDRLYSPTLRPLASALNARPYQDPRWVARVHDQGQTHACTGYALASMVELLVCARRPADAPPVAPFSPFMLYYFARRYDAAGEADQDAGATARAAMKAWQRHGACTLAEWAQLDESPTTAATTWATDAFATPLGAYFRVDHTCIADLHAALNETGAVFATAMVHAGWLKPDAATDPDGTIPWTEGAACEGGHAFLLVGYDEEGFWIQNSWGPGWGLAGFARLSYADWNANAMDAWCGQLGVPVAAQAQTLGAGLSFATAGAPQALASDARVKAQQLNPYIINLGNDGVLSDHGTYRTTAQDLRDMIGYYLPQALQQWGDDGRSPIDVALYAHGGLTDETAAAATAAQWVPALFNRRIFPIFLMWETGLLETWGDRVADAMKGLRTAGAPGLANAMSDWKDERVESLLAYAGSQDWNEMKKNAEAASSNPAGGLHQFAALLSQAAPSLLKRLRLHLVGHSAGAIFHGHLLPQLVELGLNVDGLYFMAPACRVDLFDQQILPYYQGATGIPCYTQFHLDDATERSDNCHPLPYDKSLLYLVSNAFEGKRKTPLLGMETFVKQGGLTARPPAAQVWDWIAAPSGAAAGLPLTDRSNATSHGAFSGDEATRQAIVERIACRKTAAQPSLTPA